MNMTTAKATALATMLDGQIITDNSRVELCIRGIINGFPVSLEAAKVTYPFGVNYFLETGNFAGTRSAGEAFKMTITPRYITGFFSLVSRILFFENRGQRVDYPALDRSLHFKYDNAAAAKKFIHYNDVANKILELEKMTRFNELLINSTAGIYLSQPLNFSVLEPALCKEIFITLAQLGQVLFEAF